MKLRTFEKVRNSVSTDYSVFERRNGEDVFKDFFTVNYLDDFAKLNRALTKREALEKAGAEVKFVTANGDDLDVTVVVPG